MALSSSSDPAFTEGRQGGDGGGLLVVLLRRPDRPRVERTRRHELLDIIGIAIGAVTCGAESWPAVEAFGTATRETLAKWFKLPTGIPSHDTFRRVFWCVRKPG